MYKSVDDWEIKAESKTRAHTFAFVVTVAVPPWFTAIHYDTSLVHLLNFGDPLTEWMSADYPSEVCQMFSVATADDQHKQ